MTTERRYREIYDWAAQQEASGRSRMKNAWIDGVVSGLLIVAIGYVIYFAFDEDAGLVVGLIFSLPFGWSVYQSLLASGLRMILDAQKTLVAVDTEQNTREIAESVKKTIASGSPS